MTVLTIISLVCALVAILFVWIAVSSVRNRRFLRSVSTALSGLLALALGALAGAVTIGVKGYRALTREDLAAHVRTEPIGPQRFRATVELPDGKSGQFEISGDAFYIDAHILKWKPIVNVLGLHTGYELDRVGGRYNAVDDEQGKPRTVFPLRPERRIDVFGFVRRHPRVLSPLVDAEYGSGTFVGADRPGRFDVLVSTTGLLIRPVPDSAP